MPAAWYFIWSEGLDAQPATTLRLRRGGHRLLLGQDSNLNLSCKAHCFHHVATALAHINCFLLHCRVPSVHGEQMDQLLKCKSFSRTTYTVCSFKIIKNSTRIQDAINCMQSKIIAPNLLQESLMNLILYVNLWKILQMPVFVSALNNSICTRFCKYPSVPMVLDTLICTWFHKCQSLPKARNTSISTWSPWCQSLPMIFYNWRVRP